MEDGKCTPVNKLNIDYYINKVENPDTQHYIKTRAVGQMDYYSKASSKAKHSFYSMRTMCILLGCLIPVVAVISDNSIFMKAVIAAMATAVSGLNLYMSRTNPGETWIKYRNRKNVILQTLYFYFNKSGPFIDMSQDEADKLMIELVERENGARRQL